MPIIKSTPPAKGEALLEAKAALRQMQYVDINSIHRWKENPKNPKLMRANALDLMPLLKKHGFNTPLVCWTKNRVIYKGNTTHLASEMLKLTKVPVVFVNFENEDAAIAYGLSDNNAGAKSEWDVTLLKQMMHSDSLLSYAGDEQELKLITGFKEREFKKLMLDEEPSHNPDDIGKKGQKFDVANVSFPASIEQSGYIHDTIRYVKEKMGLKKTDEAVMAIFEFYNEHAE